MRARIHSAVFRQVLEYWLVIVTVSFCIMNQALGCDCTPPIIWRVFIVSGCALLHKALPTGPVPGQGFSLVLTRVGEYLATLETKYFYTKHYSSLTPHTTGK